LSCNFANFLHDGLGVDLVDSVDIVVVGKALAHSLHNLTQRSVVLDQHDIADDLEVELIVPDAILERHIEVEYVQDGASTRRSKQKTFQGDRVLCRDRPSKIANVCLCQQLFCDKTLYNLALFLIVCFLKLIV